jgi:hypothetical protein
VGELIIAGASTNLVARRAQIPELLECASTLSGLVEEVRDSALQLRMVKIGATFKRFQRVVHDVARELGKDIRLQVNGEDAELDKTVVEKIGDPLTHLVRNAMDHGIEAAELRAARGKPAQGTVSLNAYHDSGSIVIEVSDDGGGLKRDRILAKGIERGLVEPGRTLSDKEIFNLIFEPGFSTAEQVTNLSGRGVGMDVVKRNIVALRGSVEMSSSRRRRHHGHRAAAADAGDHQRLPGRRGQVHLRDPDGHGRGMHRIPRAAGLRLGRPARPAAALRAPARALRPRRRAGAAPEHRRGALRQPQGRPGRGQPAGRVPDRDQAARQGVRRRALPVRLLDPGHRRGRPDPRHGRPAERRRKRTPIFFLI